MKTGFKIIWLDEVDSTNSYVRRHLSSLDNLSVIAAESQTAGRGQRGNKWLSKAGDNLTFSILLFPGMNGVPSIPVDRQFIISEAATIAVAEMLGEYGINAKIKWPNDIYCGDRKICGMLVENTLADKNVSASIVGIGLNVNQTDFPPELMNPCSMKYLTKRTFDTKACLLRLLEVLSAYIDMASSSPDKLKEKYLSMLYRKNESRHYTDTIEGRVFKGIIRGVSDDARLMVELEDGCFKYFAFKEISYII